MNIGLRILRELREHQFNHTILYRSVSQSVMHACNKTTFNDIRLAPASCFTTKYIDPLKRFSYPNPFSKNSDIMGLDPSHLLDTPIPISGGIGMGILESTVAVLQPVLLYVYICIRVHVKLLRHFFRSAEFTTAHPTARTKRGRERGEERNHLYLYLFVSAKKKG